MTTYTLTKGQLESLLYMQSREVLNTCIEHLNEVRPEKTYTARTLLRKGDMEIENIGIPYKPNGNIRASLCFISIIIISLGIYGVFA